MRLFWAIDIPDEIKSKLVAVQGELKKLGLHAKWVERQNIHLTIKFLGETDVSLISDMKNSVARVIKGNSPFQVSVSGFGSFGKPVRIIWFGIKNEDKKLFELHSKIDKVLVQFGFEAEKRTFCPHLTLARLKSTRNVMLLKNKLTDKMMPDILGSFTVRDVKLFKSTLTPRGAIYEVIEEIEIY